MQRWLETLLWLAITSWLMALLRPLPQGRCIISSRRVLFRLAWRPCGGVGRGGRIYAKIPHKQVDPFFIQELHHRVFPRRERFGGGDFDTVPYRGAPPLQPECFLAHV